MSKQWYHGWHFLPKDGCLTHTYPRVRVRAGRGYFHDGGIVPCSHGLHASSRAIDALSFSPGPIICRVILSGTVLLHGRNKAAASERTVLALADATNTLHEFACECAEDVLHLCGHNKDVAQKAIHTKREWLRGKATNQELAAAGRAAWGAAGNVGAAVAAVAAAGAAAWDAPGAAAGAAAGNARNAAGNAAWAAPWDAAGSARDAARAAQNSRLETMFWALLDLDPVELAEECQ